jgi:hypothetical protein
MSHVTLPLGRMLHGEARKEQVQLLSLPYVKNEFSN